MAGIRGPGSMRRMGVCNRDTPGELLRDGVQLTFQKASGGTDGGRGDIHAPHWLGIEFEEFKSLKSLKTAIPLAPPNGRCCLQ